MLTVEMAASARFLLRVGEAVLKGPLRVGVRWTGNLSGSGYYVVVADLGSTDRRRCVAGTSCYVDASKGLSRNQEMGWAIKIVLVRGNLVVSNKTICLLGV